MEQIETKWCPRCKQNLAIWQFYTRRVYRKDGSSFTKPQGYCKTCTLQAQKESRERLKALAAQRDEETRQALANYEPERWGPPADEDRVGLTEEELREMLARRPVD